MSANEEDNLSPVEDDIQIIEDNENAGVVQNNETEEANQNEDGGEAEAENQKEAKVKRVRNPQPKLDVQRLKGPRGLLMLENVFKDVKFKGRGQEEEDLCVLMKNYEYWCHRLFPKFPFDDCLERMEKLGSKKALQTFLKRIRMNLLFDDEVAQRQPDNEVVDRDEDDGEEQDVRTNSNDFDSLLPPQTQPQPTNSGATGLTEEQLERIKNNRERAQRLRQQMLIRNKANVGNLSQSDSQSSQVDTGNNVNLSQNSSICNALKDINFTENMSVDSETLINLASQNSIEGESFRFVTTAAMVHQTNASQESTISERIASQDSLENMSIGYASQDLVTNTAMKMSLDLDKISPIVSETINGEKSRDETASQESLITDANNHQNSLEESVASNTMSQLESGENMSVDSVSQEAENIPKQNSEIVDSQSSVDVDSSGCHVTAESQESDKTTDSQTENTSTQNSEIVKSPESDKNMPETMNSQISNESSERSECHSNEDLKETNQDNLAMEID